MDQQTMHEVTDALFERYAKDFMAVLHEQLPAAELASYYTGDFIAASPQGVRGGRYDETMTEALEQNFAYYRSIGTKDMQVTRVATVLLDELHAVAHVHWLTTILKGEQPVEIPFINRYFLQFREGEPLIFGWITGDEMQLLRDYGVID